MERSDSKEQQMIFKRCFPTALLKPKFKKQAGKQDST